MKNGKRKYQIAFFDTQRQKVQLLIEKIESGV